MWAATRSAATPTAAWIAAEASQGSARRSIRIGRILSAGGLRSHEIYFGDGALELVGGHELGRLHAGHSRNPPVGHDLEPRVVKRGDVVEVGAREGDALLGVGEFLLEREERLLGFQLGVALG